MSKSVNYEEFLESRQEEAGNKVMVEGPGKLLESSENAAAWPGDDRERGEESASWPGEEGRKYEDAAGSGEGGVRSEDTDEDSDPDHPKGFIGYLLDTDFVESLPVKVKYRVLALKKLQTRVVNLEAKFLREFHGIERKFAEMYQPLLEKRRQIINAIYEPTEEECEYKSDYEDYDDEEMYDEEEMYGSEEGMVHEYMDEDNGYEEDYYDYAVEEEEEDDDDDDNEDDIEATGEDNKEEDPKGIPDFWLTVLKNVDTVTPWIKKYDEPILKLLTDIKVKLSDPGKPLSFTLEFHFKPNEYFKNALLTKTYVLKSRLAYYDPHPYRGTAIKYCTGCEIDWNEGKNVTLKIIKKKQKHRIWGTIRTVTEHFPKDSFFNFFTPYRISSNGKDGNDDFLLGHNLRTYIIPRSVLFFSGDALESQQEGVVREVNDEIYDKIIYDNWMAAIEEVKTCCKNLEAMVEDIDR